MVDQPLGERGGQHQLALGNGDEAVAQAVEPELGPAGLADAGVEMMRVLDVAGRARRRREHPLANAFGQIRDGGPAAFENGRELIGDGKLQGHARLGLLDAEGERVHVDPLPEERQHLVPAHAGVETEPESVADRRVVDLGLDASTPARQHLGRRRDLPARLAVELPAAGQPQVDRIAEAVHVDAGPAVDRPQQRHRAVGRRPAVVGGDPVEAGLDITPRDGVQGTGEPVAEVAVGLVAIELVGARRPVGIGRHVVLEGVPDRRHAARRGPLCRRIAAAGDFAEVVLRHPSRLVGSNLAVAAKHDALVCGFPAAVAGTVIDDEGLGARGVDPDSESGELVVPGNPRLVGRLEGFDGALGQRRTHLRGAFSCTHLHGGKIAAVDGRVNTTVNTRKENSVAESRRTAMQDGGDVPMTLLDTVV